METAELLLGRPFELEGSVMPGDHRGTTIGFPTANMHIPEHMAMPPDGVYATGVWLNGKIWPSMTNIGNNPTFANQYRRIETNILDWHGDLYGQQLRLFFYKRLRHEITFVETELLIRQMEQDREHARTYFAQRESKLKTNSND